MRAFSGPRSRATGSILLVHFVNTTTAGLLWGNREWGLRPRTSPTDCEKQRRHTTGGSPWFRWRGLWRVGGRRDDSRLPQNGQTGPVLTRQRKRTDPPDRELDQSLATRHSPL